MLKKLGYKIPKYFPLFLLFTAPPKRLITQITRWIESTPAVCFIPPLSAIFGTTEIRKIDMNDVSFVTNLMLLLFIRNV